MASTEVDSLQDTVEQFINDENKIVTFEFLSQTCGIHVNLAKNVLSKYAEKLEKKSNSNLYQVVYSIGGYLGKNLKFLLVKDTYLNEAKLKFDKVLSTHVYSIQKGKLDSFGLLYNSNQTGLKKSIQQCSGQSAISCSVATLKTGTEVTNKVPVAVDKSNSVEKPPQPLVKKEETSGDVATVKPEHVKESSQPAQEKTTKKATEKKQVGKQAIATLFAKQAAKEPVQKKVAVEDVQKSTSNKRVVREPSDDEQENEKKENNGEKNSSSVSKRFKLSEEEKPLKSQENKTKTKKSDKKGKQTSKTSDKKQRKRIQQFSESESSGEEEDDRDVILSSPENPVHHAPMSEDDEDVINATVIEPSSNLKRSRKLVTKTYMDENGYVVTKKEYETCEENEAMEHSEPKETKKEETVKTESQPTQLKISPPKTKQKSIMSFFTRK